MGSELERHSLSDDNSTKRSSVTSLLMCQSFYFRENGCFVVKVPFLFFFLSVLQLQVEQKIVKGRMCFKHLKIYKYLLYQQYKLEAVSKHLLLQSDIYLT